MWNTPFANGRSYKDCFPDGPAVAGKYPHWDKEASMVITLALAVNECREANGEKPLKYKKGPIADIVAYMAYESRGQITNVVIPEDDPEAVEAYETGKTVLVRQRGQLNFSCATCHAQNPGAVLRTEMLSPATGTPPTGRSTAPSGARWGPCTVVSLAATSRCAPSRSRPRARSTEIWSTS